MTSNAIAIYSLKFKEGKNIKNPVEMYELINDCFRWKDGSTERDEESSRLFRINLKICNPHEIGGIIEAGRFGTGNPIVNVDSGKEEYHKNPRQSDLNPHYFLFLSRGSTRNSGYFVSERIRNDGVEGLLLNVIRKCLGGIIPIHESVMTREMIKQKLEQLKEIRLVKHVPSKDLSDAIREDTQDEGLYFEYRIRAERKKLLPPIFSRHILEFLDLS